METPPTNSFLEVSRYALERAVSALEHQIDSVRSHPQLHDNGLIGKLLKEGLHGSERALEEIKLVLETDPT